MGYSVSYDPEIVMRVKVLQSQGVPLGHISKQLNIKYSKILDYIYVARHEIKFPFDCELTECTSLIKYMRIHGLRDLTPAEK